MAGWWAAEIVVPYTWGRRRHNSTGEITPFGRDGAQIPPSRDKNFIKIGGDQYLRMPLEDVVRRLGRTSITQTDSSKQYR